MQHADLINKLDPSGDYVEEADGLVLHCPAHADSSPSLKVTITDERRALIICRAGCSTNEVLAAAGLEAKHLFNVDDASVTIAGGKPVPVTDAVALRRLEVYCENVADLPGSVLVYLGKRFGLTPEKAAELGLGYSPVPPPGEDTWDGLSASWTAAPRLVIPFRNTAGVIHGAQARALDDHPTRWTGLTAKVLPPGQAWGRYAVFLNDDTMDRWIITEGPGDALTAVAHGYNAVAIPGAALAGNSDLVGELSGFFGEIGASVYLAGDADDAGEKFNVALAELAVGTLKIPAKHGDLSAWYESCATSEQFRSELDEAIRKVKSGKAKKKKEPPRIGSDGLYLNSVGDATRVVRYLDGNALWSPNAGWFLWDGTKWAQDWSGHIRVLAGRAMAALADAAKAADKQYELNHFIIAGNTNNLSAILKEAGPLVAVDIEAMDADPDLLTFTNGTVNLRTGVLGPHAREHLITRAVGVDFHPDARAPRWERFLDEIFEAHPELPAYIRRLIGYGITGHTSEQCFAIFYGTGANGKSVLMDTISEVFSSVTNTTPFSTFERKQGGIPNDLAALKGARLVVASEGERGVPMAEAVLKRVTGQDIITARFMRQEFFSYRPTYLITLATNHPPAIRGQDEGLWRRVKMVPFTRYFAPDERDHYLARLLLDEAPGIAAWAVRGAVEWYADGLGDPAVVIEATKDYRSLSDALDGLIPDVLRPERDVRVDAGEAYHAYLRWCEQEELPLKEQWTRRTFTAALEERGYPRKKSNGNTYILGLTLHTKPANSAPTNGRPSIFGSGS